MSTEIYRVKDGQNLWVIAQAALGDENRWPEIAHLNGIRHPYIIYPGQILELPPERNSDIVEVELPDAAALATQKAGFTISPATALLLVVGAALLFLRR